MASLCREYSHRGTVASCCASAPLSATSSSAADLNSGADVAPSVVHDSDSSCSEEHGERSCALSTSRKKTAHSPITSQNVPAGNLAENAGATSSSSSSGAQSTNANSAASEFQARSDAFPMKRDRLYKVRPCKSWDQTCLCRFGADCCFAHGEVELKFWKDVAKQPRLAGGPEVKVAVTAPRHRSTCELVMMPSDIGFCHDTVASRFRDGRPILATLFDLINHRVLLRHIEKMSVVLYRDTFYSVSNRRLCLYRLCQHLGLITSSTPVKVKLLEELPPRFDRKFTTPCHGDWVRVRGDGRICGRTLADTTFGRDELFGLGG